MSISKIIRIYAMRWIDLRNEFTLAEIQASNGMNYNLLEQQAKCYSEPLGQTRFHVRMCLLCKHGEKTFEKASEESGI